MCQPLTPKGISLSLPFPSPSNASTALCRRLSDAARHRRMRHRATGRDFQPADTQPPPRGTNPRHTERSMRPVDLQDRTRLPAFSAIGRICGSLSLGTSETVLSLLEGAFSPKRLTRQTLCLTEEYRENTDDVRPHKIDSTMHESRAIGNFYSRVESTQGQPTPRALPARHRFNRYPSPA